MAIYVSYCRVSLEKQGIAGLGMEAQREAVMRYVHAHGSLIAEYTEVESGRRHKNRPQLLAAIEHCKRSRATLVIAKLDRLSRNVAFISTLLEGDVQFVCCDNPHATKTMLQMLAVFAEHEREQISHRTKLALAAAKARGVKLGNPRYTESIHLALAGRGYKEAPPEVQDLIVTWRATDTLQAIADRLNAMNVRTPQGFRWYPSSVRAVLVKIERKHGSTMGRDNEITSRLPLASLTAIPSQKGGDMGAIDEAQRMLDIFASVGARSFFVTKLDLLQQKLWGKSYTAPELQQKLPYMVRTADIHQPVKVSETETIYAGENLIVRPTGPNVILVQLDDLKADQLDRLKPASFLMLETSPSNYQAWIAVDGKAADKEAEKDIVRRIRKAVGQTDKSASGAVRMAGTSNFKLKYAPNFPKVAITHEAPGRVLSEQELTRMGLIAARTPLAAHPMGINRNSLREPSLRKWPSYQMSLAGAPMNKSGTNPDRSSADFWWCKLATQWGWSIDETAQKLLEVSDKAKYLFEHGDPGYARITAQNAAAANERERQRSRA